MQLLAATHDGTWGETEMFLIWLLTCFAWAISAAVVSAKQDEARSRLRQDHRMQIGDLNRQIEMLESEVENLESEVEDLSEKIEWLRDNDD